MTDQRTLVERLRREGQHHADIFLHDEAADAIEQAEARIEGHAATYDVHEIDGWCYYCERGHVRALRVDQPRLFARAARP